MDLHRATRKAALGIVVSIAAVLSFVAISKAQEIIGTPGAPDARRVIQGLQIPPPPDQFGGKIERNAAQSMPFWPAQISPPEGAPNVLLILLDDAGYGTNSAFGGVIPTPTLDALAAGGLRYTNLHSTALCSPTRAALLTGRNHHSVGFGVVSEQATGYPGYNSLIPKDKATIARILTDNGYTTGMWGKNHNTPAFQVSQAGPFNQWSTGMGFDYFYGFNGGDTSQWQPGPLFRNTTPIYPYVGHPEYNLVTAMADDAIEWINRVNTLAPGRPYFIYYAPGAVHAPHHPTKEWVDKISSMHLFDAGWNKLRETIFANQKRLGVIPQNAELTHWPTDLIKKWDDLSPDEKKMFIRQADVYAAYLAYTDHEIGRLIQAVKDSGEYDNTLIIFITGDNGTSAEGGPDGTPNELAVFNGVQVPVADQLKNFYDIWGTDKTYPHMSIGWSWAFDTPFKWTKQIAGYFGGTKQGTVISWPKVITDKGSIRNQFAHVNDIAPTILEAVGIREPSVVDGVAQSPMEGTSLVYTFDKERADEPSHHRTQYFEMFGEYALYHEGWIAVTKVTRPPWDVLGPVNQDPANSEWELYDLSNDWTQAHDVASAHPDKLKELQDLFWQEAAKYQVLPLDASVATRIVVPRPSITAGRTDFVWNGPLTGTPNGDAPNVLNTSYTFNATIEVPDGGCDGMLITQGGRFAGYGFYLKAGKPVFLWNLLDLQRERWEGTQALSAGKHHLQFDFKYDGLGAGTLAFNNLSGIGQGGTGTLKVDGEIVAQKRMEHTIPTILQFDENLDVGSDTGTPVDDADYQVPFAFTGEIDQITLKIERPQLTPADEEKLRAAMQMKKASE
ncbi:arylsulfatase [Rhizobium sp. BK376]|uniref:arylsulfatase n=1 Tax=Rhizobium sp. BK376 TaxID=2512149 RepID=UPI00104E6CD9|nr:arylsulfatase [Rhizobium sp. BK376]TCR66704.1 arylsulfatase [Rhizobium sp. BK376]